LTGIWHGANWTFLLWGMIYLIVLILERTTNFPTKLGPFSRVYTMMVVILAWVVFRSDNITTSANFIKNMFGIRATGFVSRDLAQFFRGTWLVYLVSIVGTTPVVKKIVLFFEKRDITWVEPIWLTLVLIASLLEIISATYNPFIYFNF